MRIREKIKLGFEGLLEHGPITIVAFGDSVTHGAVAPDEMDYETVYWNRLKKMLLNVRSYMPVNVINAGIGGITAKNSVDRMDSQVLSHHPDLIIVCFGLNDINEPLDDYLEALRAIFEKGLSSGAEVVFMTPNMLNPNVSEDTLPRLVEYARITAEYQQSGKMDLYMDSAVKLAKEMGVLVCDCYAKWKALSETQDVTMLLANRINHPTREMHQLFADSLFEVILGETRVESPDSDTMYRSGK